MKKHQDSSSDRFFIDGSNDSAFTMAERELLKALVSVFVISLPLGCSKGQAYTIKKKPT